YLREIFGFDAFCLSPLAGAHGELTSLLVAKAYFRYIGQEKRKKVIIPDSAHGTNPASCASAGFDIVSVKSEKSGGIEVDDLKSIVDDTTAVLMLTNPNTLGLFEKNIIEIADILHSKGCLFYMDGANANALLGQVKPAELGFDFCHINLHKTFSTPHGGGGPGSGPIGVVKKLEPFLPNPRITKEGSRFKVQGLKEKKSIGRVAAFYGNVNVIVKAYSYVRSLGANGLKKVSENAVLNANYIMSRLKKYYYLPYERVCQHEFVISAKWQKEKYGVRALDIAKRLLDFGFHPPTIYFPLIVEEAMMIEPTETESKETIDSFIDAMIKIAHECETDPDTVKTAPHTTYVSRLNEVKAAKDLDLCQL
ncbi:MAG: aminomethyl-transferring glycine dehydrogenase subunit GcvPB, partial [Candidatus Margulisiibacteriota bacterium]